MSELVLGLEHISAQLVASLEFADGASGPSSVILYGELPDLPRGIPAGGTIAEIVLARPCGMVAGELFTLLPASASGTMILTSGLPRWARWVRPDGKLVAAGTLTDLEHDGAFRLQGGTTPAGETSPLLQAGGLVMFGALVLG